MIAADGGADDIRLAQARELGGDEGAVLVAGGWAVEEVARVDKERRVMGDGIVYGGLEALAQPLATGGAALWGETRQRG